MGQPDARRFDRQYFIDALALIETIELFCHCGKQLGVHKMIQEPIDLQYAAGQDYPVLRDTALQKLQGAHSHLRNPKTVFIIQHLSPPRNWLFEQFRPI